ncbi:unnamed protein product [Phytophthora fragariaefolia]|uniref:Unnamed protein product n=1 Tax=Phytophthora fragariaefolia TaxID=1490495 RepID=A0A9W6YBU7_9STRA|nr:unnamed protein product [Phytophthora fragariaefolia]
MYTFQSCSQHGCILPNAATLFSTSVADTKPGITVSAVYNDVKMPTHGSYRDFQDKSNWSLLVSSLGKRLQEPGQQTQQSTEFGPQIRLLEV